MGWLVEQQGVASISNSVEIETRRTRESLSKTWGRIWFTARNACVLSYLASFALCAHRLVLKSAEPLFTTGANALSNIDFAIITFQYFFARFLLYHWLFSFSLFLRLFDCIDGRLLKRNYQWGFFWRTWKQPVRFLLFGVFLYFNIGLGTHLLTSFVL